MEYPDRSVVIYGLTGISRRAVPSRQQKNLFGFLFVIFLCAWLFEMYRYKSGRTPQTISNRFVEKYRSNIRRKECWSNGIWRHWAAETLLCIFQLLVRYDLVDLHFRPPLLLLFSPFSPFLFHPDVRPRFFMWLFSVPNFPMYQTMAHPQANKKRASWKSMNHQHARPRRPSYSFRLSFFSFRISISGKWLLRTIFEAGKIIEKLKKWRLSQRSNEQLTWPRLKRRVEPKPILACVSCGLRSWLRVEGVFSRSVTLVHPPKSFSVRVTNQKHTQERRGKNNSRKRKSRNRMPVDFSRLRFVADTRHPTGLSSSLSATTYKTKFRPSASDYLHRQLWHWSTKRITLSCPRVFTRRDKTEIERKGKHKINKNNKQSR